MEQTNRKKRPCRGVLRIVALVLCGLILGINVYFFNANSLVGNQLPMPLGFGVAVVLSGSMEPEFSKGDLIFVTETAEYHERDIVVFQDGNSLVVHRIVKIDGDAVTTQGDANNTPDEPIDRTAIKGKVVFDLPFVGNIVTFLKTPIGIICILAAALALIEIPRRRAKKQDLEEKQRILEEIKRLREKD
ncbi:MAG: signal peptidase I [Clostridia bacterium]|nr:signal peptidase I [Clostridia bacterium]